MNSILHLFALLIISVSSLNCKDDQKEDIANQNTIVISFEYGADLTPTAYKNIYVIWVENEELNFIQNISVCQELIKGGLTGTALPFWKINKYPVSSGSGIDAVTSATKANTSFSVSAVLKDNNVRSFVLYFEIDRSYEPNDWFSDQPALLYKADIDLDNSQTSYELFPAGWTPNESTQNIIPGTPIGKLQPEMRYITNYKVGSSFGTTDPRSATKMVKKITATIESSLSTEIIDTKNRDITISVYPNPTTGTVNILSSEIINELIINDLQGKIILRMMPGTLKTTFSLNKGIAPAGSYLASIRTAKGERKHKIVITE